MKFHLLSVCLFHFVMEDCYLLHITTTARMHLVQQGGGGMGGHARRSGSEGVCFKDSLSRD